MKILETQEIKTTQTYEKDIICNCCGGKIKKGEDIHKGCPYEIKEEHIEIKSQFGYFSNYFEDGDYFTVDICEKCFYDWVQKFKVTPEVKNEFS